MTPAQFRKMALRFPGVVESAHMNHPDFRVGGKIFASRAVFAAMSPKQGSRKG